MRASHKVLMFLQLYDWDGRTQRLYIRVRTIYNNRSHTYVFVSQRNHRSDECNARIGLVWLVVSCHAMSCWHLTALISISIQRCR